MSRPVRYDRGYVPLPFFADNLNLADVGNIDPFPARDFLCQRLQVALDRFTDNRFGQTVTLPGDEGYSLSVVHFFLPLKFGDKGDNVTM